jgi:Carboxypeptidase regulatory-like domain
MALRHPAVRQSQTPRGVAARWFGPALMAVLVAALVGVPAASSAQAIRGTLLGTVTDSSGAAVPGATVTITEVRTNISASTTTNESGNYTFPNLREGFYRVEGELSGFKKVIRDNVQVDVNTSVRVDMELAAGEVTETVTVASEVPALQTDRADTGRIIEGQQIQAMPLGFNRNFQGMLATVPGASRPFRPHSEFFNPHDSLSTNVNGQSRLANNVQIEGVDNNHKTGLLTVLIPSAEALEEVSVTTSNYDAELGRAGGAVTSVTLKSGTNQFKGSGFWFGNNESTRAKDPFVDRTLPEERQKAEELYNQYGFTLGGPIVRNKLFFFGDYVRTDDDLGRINRVVVPNQAFRSGDFSAVSTPIFDPLTGDADGNGRQQFPNNQIPADRISPIAREILANVPLPNIDAALGQANYQVATTRERRTDGFDVKVNYQATEKDQIAGRYSFQRPTIFEPSPYGIYGGPFPTGSTGFLGTGTNLTFSTAANWTRTWSNTLVMDVRGGLSYYHNEALSLGTGLTTATDIGIRGANLDEYTSGMTQIQLLNGWTEPFVGFSASLPWDRSERTINAAVTLTKLWGNHTIKVGGDIRHNRDFLLQTQEQGGPRGRFTFNAAQTGSPTSAASQSGLANAFAAFLLDRPSAVGRDLAVIAQPGTKHTAMFTFIHDKWQLSPKITVDIGLRHEYYTPLVGIEGKGGLSNYDPVTNTLRVSGYGDIPDDVGVEGTWRNFDPRLGISYRMNEKTVLRAGFGSGTMPFPDNSYAFNFPVKQNNQFTGSNTFVGPNVNMATGFPAPIQTEIPANGIIEANTPLLRNQQYFIVPSDLKEGRLYSWNVAFQRELPWSFTGEIAYVGNRGDGVLARLDMNAGLVPGLDNAGRPQFAPFNRTGTSTNLGVPTTTRYHSMQVKVDRRFKNNFLVTNSYTLGRSKAYSNGDSNGDISTPANIELSYGRIENDRLHTFVSSFVYMLPFKSEGPLNWVIGGWQVSGLFTAQSGRAVDITMSGALLRAPGNTQRPNMNGKAQILHDVAPGTWFDTSVFSAPEPNTFGNLTRRGGGVDGPAFINLDASLVKRFEVGGGRYGEFRVDAFNATNSPHYDLPNGTFQGATFGQVTNIIGGTTRLVRFGVRFVF